ncbi:MAG TPA: ABC transporter ATP-binding protein [Methanothrix sp.]|jgi:iron complex transport system ATP-binding protein|nr:ABC transporter ATP-binding protein [Methanothrix sp.]
MDVEFGYASTPILQGVHLELAKSEVLSIVGPNGAGKSTLIRCINRILNPQKGRIVLDGSDITNLTRMELARQLGYIPQSDHQSFPATVFDVVLMGRRPHISWRSCQNDKEKVLDVLEMLNIEHLAMRDINEISGGQQQKVLIARALAQEPDVLLLDEPTSNLDIRHQLEVMDVIRTLVTEKNISAIMAIHDLNLGSRYSDRMVMLNRGVIAAAGNPYSVLTQENIKQVYGVEAVVKDEDGFPYVVPKSPVGNNGGVRPR